MQKALRDQIIEGLHDGDTIQELLQSKDLTLDQTITKCQGLEAAKKSRAEIQHTPETYSVHAVSHTSTCIVCGDKTLQGGHKNCPAYKRTCRKCGKIGHFSKVCRQSLPLVSSQALEARDQQRACTLSTSELPFIQATSESFKTAPTITMNVSTPHGQATLQVLPDSGADICAAGKGLTLCTPWENTWIIWQTPQSHQDQSMTPSSNQQERFQM